MGRRADWPVFIFLVFWGVTYLCGVPGELPREAEFFVAVLWGKGRRRGMNVGVRWEGMTGRIGGGGGEGEETTPQTD